jgi:HPt (histidine-containing phosphotransfer) domain-containing protein
VAEPLIDRRTYDALVDSVGDDFAVELVDTFLEEAPAMLAELRVAMRDGNHDAYRRVAHTLKSNSNTFGAFALGELARAAELGGLTGDPDADRAALDELEASYAAVAAALNELAHR